MPTVVERHGAPGMGFTLFFRRRITHGEKR